MSSAACSQLLLYSWLPLAGGGALVVGGLGSCAVTGSTPAAYVARFDNALPLAATTAAGGVGAGQLWPNPARASEGAMWQGAVPAGAGRAELVLLDALGRPVRCLALAGRGSQVTLAVPLAGLPPGAYVARLLVDGLPQGPASRLLVEP